MRYMEKKDRCRLHIRATITFNSDILIGVKAINSIRMLPTFTEWAEDPFTTEIAELFILGMN